VSEQPEVPPGPVDPAFLEALAQAASGGLPLGVAAVADTMAAVHAKWYQAWQDAGFAEHRAFALTELMVAEAFRTR
jgi:hypothetical protein